MMTTNDLAVELDLSAGLPPEWRQAFLSVPRHQFLPDRIWVDDDSGQPQPISRTDDPDRWWQVAYRNIPVLTQFDDGRTTWPDANGELCTSSASKPDLVLRMLTALDVRPGHRVLEIGTGTGYNAALLAARIGAPNVTTVEIDPELAESAREALAAISLPATVVIGDGTLGWPDAAPYDRVIVTASVRFGELPHAWIDQVRPGGIIVVPMRTDFGGAVPLMRFDVGDDGTAVGVPVDRVGFMAIRSQRTPHWAVDGIDPDDPAARISTTTLKPWRVAENHDVRWAIGTRVPSCVWEHQSPAVGRPHHLLWLVDPSGGSWAVASYDELPGPRSVRQFGPRALWDEVEAAFRAWAADGKPTLERSRIVVTATSG